MPEPRRRHNDPEPAKQINSAGKRSTTGGYRSLEISSLFRTKIEMYVVNSFFCTRFIVKILTVILRSYCRIIVYEIANRVYIVSAVFRI